MRVCGYECDVVLGAGLAGTRRALFEVSRAVRAGQATARWHPQEMVRSHAPPSAIINM